jgi:two-component system CheB/CheR fusion protein
MNPSTPPHDETPITAPLDGAPNPAADADDAATRLDFPVVGIGASAGALGALTTLFESMPPEPGMAFIVVVHLSPDHESHLASILSRTSRVPVLQVTDAVTIERDHVYVISPRLEFQLENGTLRVTPAEIGARVNTAIDKFLRALGDVHRERAIGVVMSGMGTDGALGLRRIKERGGVTFAQTPEEAEFDSMPLSAITEGAVDFVVPAGEMGDRLVALWENARRIELPDLAGLSLPVAQPATPTAAAEAERALHEVMTMLRDRTGHDFKHYKPATVLRRIERRMQVTQVTSLPAYSQYLRHHADETAALLKDLLISVTNFFRDPAAFEALETALAPRIEQAAANSRRVRAWVAGCATGEEAYSVAIVLSELAARQARPLDLHVFASDIDEHAIALARTGMYPDAIAADVSLTRLRDFFQRDHAHYRVRKELREKILFATHNLLRDPPFSNLDLVCCRNLLIYLDREVQQQVMQVLHFALRPGGLLFLGTAESADAAQGLFTLVDKRHRIYSADDVPRVRRGAMPVMPWNLRLKRPTPRLAHALHRFGVPAEVHDQVRLPYAPATVLTDASYNLLHSTLQSETYLRFATGTPSQNLLELVRPELASELRTALLTATKEGCSVEARRVQVQLGDEWAWITMVVRPVDQDGTRYMLVAFDAVQRVLAKSGGRGRKDPTVVMLEEELKRTREELRGSLGESATSHEELRASNEELQSMNEELRSITEELETSKEELQSLNEELITVNQELKAKVDEAAQVNDDLVNLISSTDIATIFVDRAMRIKRYTPRASQLFNLLSGDHGRSLLHITHSLVYPDLEKDAIEAFESLRVTEREVRAADGRQFLARVLPYRTQQDVIGGAVLTFVDISATRRAQAQVRAGEANLRLLVESTKDFAIITLDTEGLVTSWNGGARRMFGYSEADIIGQPIDLIFTVHDRADGVPKRERDVARTEGRASDERWHLRQDGTSFFCSGIMTPMYEDDRLVGYAKIARDLTDSKRAEIQLGALLEKETEVRAELQRAIAMKDEFLAVMSHELKHPLNLIHVNAELLARLPEARGLPAVTHAADVIRRAVLSQAKITDDLHDLSRLRTGKLTINAAPLYWPAVVHRVADAVAEDAAAKGLAIVVDAGEPNLMVYADPVRVEQIVWNLVSNALKFTPPGGRIELHLLADGDECRLDVKDTGQGIPAEFIDSVFEMFRQADRSTTRQHGGMGIGLALVKHLAEEQGGRVAVASAGPGLGATFSVWLPMAGTAGGDQIAGAPNPPLARLRILVVDDADDALESFAALLRLEGGEVTAVNNAKAALAELASQPFDLMISDVAMPGMDGYELVAELRRNPRTGRLPAIALTGFGRPQEVQRALEAGFTAHLTKPVVINQLHEALRRLALTPSQSPGRV